MSPYFRQGVVESQQLCATLAANQENYCVWIPKIYKLIKVVTSRKVVEMGRNFENLCSITTIRKRSLKANVENKLELSLDLKNFCIGTDCFLRVIGNLLTA